MCCELLTSSSSSVKYGPLFLLTAMMTATTSLPFMMGLAKMLRVVYSVSSSTNVLKWLFWKSIYVYIFFYQNNFYS